MSFAYNLGSVMGLQPLEGYEWATAYESGGDYATIDFAEGSGAFGFERPEELTLGERQILKFEVIQSKYGYSNGMTIMMGLLPPDTAAYLGDLVQVGITSGYFSPEEGGAWTDGTVSFLVHYREGDFAFDDIPTADGVYWLTFEEDGDHAYAGLWSEEPPASGGTGDLVWVVADPGARARDAVFPFIYGDGTIGTKQSLAVEPPSFGFRKDVDNPSGTYQFSNDATIGQYVRAIDGVGNPGYAKQAHMGSDLTVPASITPPGHTLTPAPYLLFPAGMVRSDIWDSVKATIKLHGYMDPTTDAIGELFSYSIGGVTRSVSLSDPDADRLAVDPGDPDSVYSRIGASGWYMGLDGYDRSNHWGYAYTLSEAEAGALHAAYSAGGFNAVAFSLDLNMDLPGHYEPDGDGGTYFVPDPGWHRWNCHYWGEWDRFGVLWEFGTDEYVGMKWIDWSAGAVESSAPVITFI